MLHVGITGCIGSGKSLVTDLLKEAGALSVSMDEAGRWAVEKNENVKRQIRKAFGESVFDDPWAQSFLTIVAH